MKSITIQQALVLVACLAAPIVAYKLLSSVEAAGATAMVGMIVNFLMGRSDPPEGPSAGSGGGPTLVSVSGGGKTVAKSIGFVVGLSLMLSGCAAFQKDVNSALDVAQVACIIANAESADATVAQVCGVADILIPDLEKILAEQRTALAKAKKDAACRK